MASAGLSALLALAVKDRGGLQSNREIRDLIRQMCKANPLWGAPRIHGELLKLGIEVSQATVAKYMIRRRGRPSPTWRSSCATKLSASPRSTCSWCRLRPFRLLFVMLILAHDRRKICAL